MLKPRVQFFASPGGYRSQHRLRIACSHGSAPWPLRCCPDAAAKLGEPGHANGDVLVDAMGESQIKRKCHSLTASA